MVTNEEQALFIKEKFLEDPSKIYSEIISLLTKKPKKKTDKSKSPC